MIDYILRRLLLLFPTLFGISIVVFAITRMVPGGPVEQYILAAQSGGMGEGKVGSSHSRANQSLSEEQIADLKVFYGLDKPLPEAYFEWVKKTLALDLGVSTRFQDPVWDLIKERLSVSAWFGILAMLCTYLISLPLGFYKALKHKSWFDSLSSVFVFIGYAIPSFVLGIGLLGLFAVKFEWFPMGGIQSDQYEDLGIGAQFLDRLYYGFLPLLAYIAGSFAVQTFMMKNNLLEQLSADYMRTALARGLSYRQAVLRHALRNSLIPLATQFGNNLSLLLAGSFLIEKIFNIDGIGLLGYESLMTRDYPVVMGILVITAALQLLGNVLSDLCVALVDPRIQYR